MTRHITGNSVKSEKGNVVYYLCAAYLNLESIFAEKCFLRLSYENSPMLHLLQHLSSTLINIEKIKNPFIDAVRCCKQLLNMTFLIRDFAKNNPENVILDS